MNKNLQLKISIGILAYNESSSIGSALRSLLQQSLFQKPDPNIVIEIVVVPNGCTDDTAAFASLTLKELVTESANSNVRWQVCEVEQPGKPNAWNLYVHQFSDTTADYLFLMDADIKFLDPDTLRSMIDTLESTPDAWISVDKPVKDVALKEKKNLIEKLSVSVSGLSGSGGAAWICGQLYCGRASVLRRIYLPSGLSADDSFLYTMVVTDCLTSPDVFERVVLAKSASHIFEAYTNLNHLLRHEQWLVVSNIINSFVYDYLRAGCNETQDVTLLIKEKNDQDPLWVSQIIQTMVSKKGWWLIPPELLFRRFKNLRHKPPQKVLFLIPLAVTAFFVDLLILLKANRQLHLGSGLGYGGKGA
ncbi:glycosyltransferase [Lyngbya aestuarii]|uniref:glycosyltransferase n=1 Tax=Lyngbya aestuarii TaxID=118322 RepID=UPI00403DF574